MKTLLWLDDIRDPAEDNGKWLVFSPIEQPFKVVWVKTYAEFVYWISQNGLPDAVCFDHDLGLSDAKKMETGLYLAHQSLEGEKTGYDCAKWLVEYCIKYQVPLPKWNIQSANPVGKENIQGLLVGYLKHSKQGT